MGVCFLMGFFGFGKRIKWNFLGKEWGMGGDLMEGVRLGWDCEGMQGDWVTSVFGDFVQRNKILKYFCVFCWVLPKMEYL